MTEKRSAHGGKKPAKAKGSDPATAPRKEWRRKSAPPKEAATEIKTEVPEDPETALHYFLITAFNHIAQAAQDEQLARVVADMLTAFALLYPEEDASKKVMAARQAQ